MATSGRKMQKRLFQRTVTLEDGTEITLRPIRPDDGGRLRRLHARLSPESRYLRFMSPMPELPDRLVDYLVHVDYLDRYALAAELDGEIVGVSRYDRIAPDRAEVAVVVEDGMQRRGIGTQLLTRLAGIARRRGIVAFEGDVLAENRQMLELARQLGAGVSIDLTEESVLADLTWPAARRGAEVRRLEIPLARGGIRKLVRALAMTQSILLPPSGFRSRIPGLRRRGRTAERK